MDKRKGYVLLLINADVRSSVSERVHWMEFADTTLGISEQYLCFATRLGWLTTEFAIVHAKY
jgi:hypothetical protein